MGSEQNRFPQQERRKRWVGCWGGGGLSCFRTQKGGKRIVPASRIPEGTGLLSVNQQNGGPQSVGLPNQTTTLAPSLLAPPSSPASFTNSALPSTAQSPTSFLSLSANSPGGPSSAMYATGPYAHETQLVSPPVFSTFTTEPSTAPLTPPPELAHLTTPSSPDVPFAQFLSSSVGGTANSNYNDLQVAYSLYPGSPASSLRSPISSSFPERDFLPQWDPSVSPQNNSTTYQRTRSGRFFGNDNSASMLSQDSNFFCPATFAQFYLDHAQQSNPPFPHSGGRLSLSRESDVYSNGGNGHQNKHNKSCKQDVEEIEAYRASFGFSADEIITTNQYVEISDADVLDDSFTITPFTSYKVPVEEESSVEPGFANEGPKAQKNHADLLSPRSFKLVQAEPVDNGVCHEMPAAGNAFKDQESQRQPGEVSGSSNPTGNCVLSDEEDIFAKMRTPKFSRKYHMGSSSDAEIDYRRVRSLRGRQRTENVS